MKNTTKKVAKKVNVKQATECSINCCSTGHKIWSAVALAGLFACGLILGLSYREPVTTRQALSAEQCDAMANEIVNITTQGANADNVDVLNELQERYLSDCAGRLVVIEKEPVSVAEEKSEIMSTCSRIESILKQRLYPEDSPEYSHHLVNADTYSSIAESGCAENSDMYKTLALRELEIATALQPERNMDQGDATLVIDTFKKLDMQREAEEKSEIMSTCSRIESILKQSLYSEDSPEYIHHLLNADKYSSMAESGCAENADMYKTLALRELEIATALQPEENMSERGATLVIDTFKKLDMQREAEEFLDKMKQLIDPATDFILKMEQIINE